MHAVLPRVAAKAMLAGIVVAVGWSLGLFDILCYVNSVPFDSLPAPGVSLRPFARSGTKGTLGAKCF